MSLPPRQVPSCQLYLVSPLDVTGSFPQRLEDALRIGAHHIGAFQLRLKGVAAEEATRLGGPLREICLAADVAFMVNDDVALAKRLKADGVHLGQSDGPVSEAREILGRTAQIGVTCHNSRHLAMEAGVDGADYVAFGAFFPSGTKATEFKAEPEILTWWSRLFELPCVAIGGITAENCAPLLAAGADFLAVSGGVWHQGAEKQNVLKFVEVLQTASSG